MTRRFVKRLKSRVVAFDATKVRESTDERRKLFGDKFPEAPPANEDNGSNSSKGYGYTRAMSQQYLWRAIRLKKSTLVAAPELSQELRVGRRAIEGVDGVT